MSQIEHIAAIRGATTVPRDDPTEIARAVSDLMTQLLSVNRLEISHIVSAIFTVTSDIHSANPATALRKDARYRAVPLLCVQEAHYQGSMPLVIRLLLHLRNISAPDSLRALYLEDASTLRPDLQ